VSWVDFIFFEMVEMMIHVFPYILEEKPELAAYHSAVRNLPGLKQYLESDRNIEKHRAFNNTQAKINSHVAYTLHYFPLYGRGEPIRMLLSHAGIHYNDHLISFQEWPAIKPTMPGNVIPCLELVNGKQMGETSAIMRYLAINHGYYPEDPLLAHKSEEILDEFQTLFENVPKPAFVGPEEAAALLPVIFDDKMPKFLAAIEPHLKANKFIGGNKLSFADFFVGGSIYCSCATNPRIYSPEKWAALVAKFPTFRDYGERFKVEMSSYLNSDKRGTFHI